MNSSASQASKTRVIVTHRAPGFHCWPDAPVGCEHLRKEHRHEFRYRVEWVVTHDDRDIEFHLAQADLRNLVTDHGALLGKRWGTASCEQIAKWLYDNLQYQCNLLPPNAIEVWEDGENGARVEFGDEV